MASFRFLHAADIHLDSPLRGLANQEGNAARRVRTATSVMIVFGDSIFLWSMIQTLPARAAQFSMGAEPQWQGAGQPGSF